MYTCAECTAVACHDHGGQAPKNCPMRVSDAVRVVIPEYLEDGTSRFFKTAAAIEAIGYCRWPRLRETAEFCRRMRYARLGMAFCVGLHREARAVAQVLRSFGFEVESVACKTGGIPKSEVGIPPEHHLRPGSEEAMCNPIAQARLLNERQTEFNILVGLCVGHDSLFYRHSLAPVTTLVAKDRVLAHNPAGAVYCMGSYFAGALAPDSDES